MSLKHLFGEEENSDKDSDDNLIPEQIECRIGTTDFLSFNNRDYTIAEDTSEGCGGKTWEAATVLSNHLVHLFQTNQIKKDVKFLEVGSGTGLVGIVCGNLLVDFEFDQNSLVVVTDLEYCVKLINKNVEINSLSTSNIIVQELRWGLDTIPNQNFDYILAADCVYLESFFDPLIKTFLDFCPVGSKTVIILVSKKRRKADKKFLVKLKKSFHVNEYKNDPNHVEFKKDDIHIHYAQRK